MSFEISIGPRVRKSPYFDATVAAGVTSFSIYNHMYMPTSYGDLAAEYRRLINGAAMWDVGAQRQVELVGADAGRLAQMLGTRNLAGTEIGQAKYMPMCDHEGRLINDPLILRVDEDRWWISIADGDMLPWCRAIAFERDLDVVVDEPDVSPLAVQGPLAENVIARLLGEWVRDIPFFRYRPAEVDGIPLWVGRAGWSKQGGFELYLCDHTRGTELWELVANAGSADGIGPGAPNYIERVEGALLSYRADTEFDTDPFELGMERWVDLDQDFIGRDALVARRTTGPRRLLVGMFLDGDPLRPNAHAWPARVGDTVVGWVKAVAHSPRLNRNIALALMTSPHDRPGTEVNVTTETDDLRRGEMTTLPFVTGSLRSE